MAHKIEQAQSWAIEVRANYHQGNTELFDPGGLHFIVQASLETGEIEEVDFAYVELPHPIETTYQEYTPFAGLIREASRFNIRFDPDLEPSERSVYGFYGQTVDGIVPNGVQFGNVIEPDLRYVGREDDLLVFRLNHHHPGHDYYQGCSGAPIIDGAGRTHALVVGGDPDHNFIFGVSLRVYAGIWALG